MAVLWADERLTSAQLIQDMEAQRQHWLETAFVFERLKDQLTNPAFADLAAANARSCRQRAEKLERLIRKMR